MQAGQGPTRAAGLWPSHGGHVPELTAELSEPRSRPGLRQEQASVCWARASLTPTGGTREQPRQGISSSAALAHAHGATQTHLNLQDGLLSQPDGLQVLLGDLGKQRLLVTRPHTITPLKIFSSSASSAKVAWGSAETQTTVTTLALLPPGQPAPATREPPAWLCRGLAPASVQGLLHRTAGAGATVMVGRRRPLPAA